MNWKARIIVKHLFGCIIILLLVFSSGVLAAENSSASFFDVYEMKETVVTATRVQTSRKKTAANISVVTAEDMEKMPASNAAEVLQYIPGVYVEFNGGPGSDATGVRIQGSETRHVTVLQDGVPLNQLANPLTNLSYLPVDTIDRIEVYKGTASSAWGSALGGVINIITKDPDPLKPVLVDARISFGEFKTSKDRGTLSGTNNRFSYLLSLTHDQSDGFIEHSEYQQSAVYAKANYDLGTASRLNLACFYDKGQNADPVPNFTAFWDDIQQKRTYQRLLFETSPADNLTLTFEGRHHQFDNFVEDVYVDRREVFNDYQDEIFGGSARMNWNTTETNTLNLGFDGDWGDYDWKNYTKVYETANWALFANDTLTSGNLTLNAGVRYDDNKDFGSEISPSVGLVYGFPAAGALVRTQITKGFSAPPAAWVHDPQFGNPDLEPEIAVNYQLGGQVRLFRFVKCELNLFRANVDDLIRYNSSTTRYENIDKVRRQGAEASVTANFDFGLALSLSGSYVDVRDKNTDNVIEDIPRTTYNVSAAYARNRITHSVIGKYIDHNSSYPETQDKVFVFNYLFKLNLLCPERYGKVSIFGAVYNVFNTTYLYREIWPKPDRWIEGGLRFEY